MRVLIAEDDMISRKVLESTLKKWDYEVIVTVDGGEALEVLKGDDPPRLAILDWMMPELSGPEVCRGARQLDGGDYFYLMLLTAKGRKEDIVEGLESGADDYLVKPFDSRELRVRVRCAQRIIELQEQLIAARDELQIQATHDPLTGLYNRGAIFDSLEKENSRRRRDQTHLGVVMFDLDHFKSVNDTYGHAVGDVVLKETARRLGTGCRQYDIVGRYGGEEFLIVLPDIDAEGAASQAERVRCMLADEPFDIGEQQLPVTASIGVSCTQHLDTDDMDELVKAADDSLYLAKRSGRNRVQAAWEKTAEIAPAAG